MVSWHSAADIDSGILLLDLGAETVAL
jgi:hypothetical protein